MDVELITFRQTHTRRKLFQTNCFWISVQLQARQAQLKRRLAVIVKHGKLCCRMEAVHLAAPTEPCSHFPRVPQGDGKGDRLVWISYVFTGGASSPVCRKLLCFDVLSEALGMFCHFPLQSKVFSPPSGGLGFALTVSPQSHTLQTCSLGDFSGITNKEKPTPSRWI